MDYLDRLEQDYKDIREKIGALAHFLEFGNDNLNEAEEGLLSVQYATMEAYSNVLYQRLKLRKKALRDSNMEVMEEGKTVAELYTEYRNGERDL
jgi:hypothetical protein